MGKEGKKVLNQMIQLFCPRCARQRWHNLALGASNKSGDVWRCTGCAVERGK